MNTLDNRQLYLVNNLNKIHSFVQKQWEAVFKGAGFENDPLYGCLGAKYICHTNY